MASSGTDTDTAAMEKFVPSSRRSLAADASSIAASAISPSSTSKTLSIDRDKPAMCVRRLT